MIEIKLWMAGLAVTVLLGVISWLLNKNISSLLTELKGIREELTALNRSNTVHGEKIAVLESNQIELRSISRDHERRLAEQEGKMRLMIHGS